MSRRKALLLQTWGFVPGAKLSHQATCPLQKWFWLDGSPGLQPRSVWIALADGLWNLAGKTLRMKPSMTGKCGPCPFWIIPWHLLYNWRRARKTSGRVAGDYSLRRRGCFLWTASADLLNISPPRLPVGEFSHPLFGTGAFQDSETKGFPSSVNVLSKLSVSALMWSANNGIPKSSCICLFLTYQSPIFTMRRHLNRITSIFGRGCGQRDSRSGMFNPS
jgi:hypothetical protein